MEPNDLAAQLGVNPKTLRSWLRRTYRRSAVDHNTRWNLTEAQVAAARAHFGPAAASPIMRRSGRAAAEPDLRRATSDEAYVIDLCDEIVGERALRQHRFEWLLGSGSDRGEGPPSCRQHTATVITSGGKLKPTNAEADGRVGGRRRAVLISPLSSVRIAFGQRNSAKPDP